MSRERATKALEATRSIGLPSKEVVVVLKDLLKVYDNKWELIEAENYRALVDAYFESKDTKTSIAKGGKIQMVKEEKQVVSKSKSQQNTPVPVSCPDPRPTKKLCGASVSVCSGSRNHNSKQQQLTKSNVNVSDISNGSEKVKISLVNEIGKADLPKFKYMSHCVPFQAANLQISLARISDEDCCLSCEGNCLDAEVPCACARETGGEFAYTKDGLVKEEFLKYGLSEGQNILNQQLVYCQDCPLERSKNEYSPQKCKGHVVRKFIKECWTKCGCHMNCGNRVVQRGLRLNLQVYMTGEAKGWGVRTLEKLAKGTFVCEYVGEILTNSELYYRNLESTGRERHTYPVTLDADWDSEKLLKDDEALCLDATFRGNVARFINHRCRDANLIDIPIQVESPDRHYYHLAFFTTREVDALEELTWDYGIDFGDEDHPIPAFSCCCGSAFCRDVKPKG